ncbi:DUF7159 family protein [Mycobacterium vicinigordonae]|uniref:DUF7159 domain-containing protein n=1 Tax=Mycobacterium vicinigordonae TaxID=1719132 RepID=A0A7D6ISV8_9MYCO|nr:hypothetical protein [Mycobacterium vicinigordonae]QLL08019.1 hypothetical protein H0P51_03260 [Mycobacterium vicinigordonae]
MDTVLGVSMAPSAVRMVLVEGEDGNGALVDQEVFDVDTHPSAANAQAAEQVISAILGTREGAAEGGYQLASTGVTWRDQDQATALRDALANRKIENVMLVSAFLAAAALAHSVGNETNYAQTALLFIEPDTATLAVVDSADGSITDIHRQRLPDDDDAAVAQLVELAAGADALETRPDALFVVGSGVDIPLIKPTLEAATTLPVTAAEEPETALARGAALASAHFPLLSSSTAAQAYAQAPSTGTLEAYSLDPALFDGSGDGLAYSAVDDAQVDDEQDDRKPFALLASILLSIFVIGVASLVVSLAVSMRDSSGTRPNPGQAAVVPDHQVPQSPAPAPQAPAPQAPTPAPQQAPIPEQAPAPQAPAPETPAQVPQVPAQVPQVPAPVVEAPAPEPAAPAPVPIAPIPVPIPIPPIFTPQLPSVDPPGRGGGPGKPPGIGKPPSPKGPGIGGKGPGRGGGRGGFNIPGIPGI